MDYAKLIRDRSTPTAAFAIIERLISFPKQGSAGTRSRFFSHVFASRPTALLSQRGPTKAHSFTHSVLMGVDFCESTEATIDAEIECSMSSTFKSDDFFFLW